MALRIPELLALHCRKTPERAGWLARLPELARDLESRWKLQLGQPFDGAEVSCSWVSPVRLANGTAAVLKLGMPHMEGEHEIQGLRFWNGDPTVRLLDADDQVGAMLLEQCRPGTSLRGVPEAGQDVILASLLRRMWRLPQEPHSFRPLATLIEFWSAETRADDARWSDRGLVEEGLRAFHELGRTAPAEVLLATDLHAGNVLRAEREPWLVIDPKPFIGDPAYDATQHLFNCDERMRMDPLGTIRRFADLLGVDRERVRWWTFARAAAEPREDWGNEDRMGIARAVAP